MRYFLIIFLLLISGLAVYYFYPIEKLPAGAKIDKIEIFKSKRELLVYAEGKLLKTYYVALGKQPVGDKQQQGDSKTPEGNYKIIKKLDLGVSEFHRGLYLNYPNQEDKKKGKTGSDILIHGLDPDYNYYGRFHRWKDWTQGCIALTDEEIDQIYFAVTIGTPVTIYP